VLFWGTDLILGVAQPGLPMLEIGVVAGFQASPEAQTSLTERVIDVLKAICCVPVQGLERLVHRYGKRVPAACTRIFG